MSKPRGWRLKRLSALACLTGGMLTAQAQIAAGLQAQVYAVRGQGHAAAFTVLQVKLPSASATRRLNRTLVRLQLNDNESDSLASLPKQLQQAARSCCYNAATHEWQVGQGTTGCAYKVLLNSQGLLSLAFTFDINGAYSWQQTRHATFDLRTGRQLALTDIIADSPTHLAARMHGAISRRIGETLTQVKADDGDATAADLAERWNWQPATHRVQFAESNKEGASGPDLTDFALTPTTLLLFYNPPLPHVIFNFASDDTYRFPYGRLQVRPLLRAVIAAKTSKSTAHSSPHQVAQ